MSSSWNDPNPISEKEKKKIEAFNMAHSRFDNFFLYDVTDDDREKFHAPVALAQRNGSYNTTGKEIQLSVNTYDITSYPTKIVYQYDVSILFRSPVHRYHGSFTYLR